MPLAIVLVPHLVIMVYSLFKLAVIELNRVSLLALLQEKFNSNGWVMKQSLSKLSLSRVMLLLQELLANLITNIGNGLTATNGQMLNSNGSKLVAATVLRCLTLTVKNSLLLMQVIKDLKLPMTLFCLLAMNC